MSFGLFDREVMVPRAIFKRLELVAAEVSMYEGKDIDANDLARAVLIHFCRQYVEGTTRSVARMMRGDPAARLADDMDADDTSWFRVDENTVRRRGDAYGRRRRPGVRADYRYSMAGEDDYE